MYKADSDVVDLQALCPNFYSLAMKMPLIDPVQCKDITASALQVWQCRQLLTLPVYSFYYCVFAYDGL